MRIHWNSRPKRGTSSEALRCLLPFLVAGSARESRFIGAMAVHAARHRNVSFPRDAVALGHRPVAGFARGAGIQMAFVTEFDITRYLVDADPRNRAAGVCKRRELQNGRAVFLDRNVTRHAL